MYNTTGNTTYDLYMVNDFGQHMDPIFRGGGDLYVGATYRRVYTVIPQVLSCSIIYCRIINCHQQHFH